MDIATELSHHASQVYLSTRSGTWILPRSTLFGIPVDNLSSRAAHYIPRSLMNLALQSLTRLHHVRFDVRVIRIAQDYNLPIFLFRETHLKNMDCGQDMIYFKHILQSIARFWAGSMREKCPSYQTSGHLKKGISLYLRTGQSLRPMPSSTVPGTRLKHLSWIPRS